MDDMQEKLGAMLNNPQLMQQIMQMAQSLGQPPAAQQAAPDFPDEDTLQKLFTVAKGTMIDPQQQALLTALGPYLNTERIHRLEKAMRAAKLAALAGTILGPGGLPIFSGR